MKHLLSGITRLQALEDIRLNNAVGAVVGPLASEKNATASKKWMAYKERDLNA